jgi:hypothetical protein
MSGSVSTLAQLTACVNGQSSSGTALEAGVEGGPAEPGRQSPPL